MSKVADFIERHREFIVQRFLEEAGKLESARGLKPYEVIDTLPEYLTTLATISRQGHRGDPAKSKKRLEETHIGLRLRLGYKMDEATSEYVLMGRLITTLWESLPPEQQPSPEDTGLFFGELRDAMDQVVATFSGYALEDRQREKRTLRRLDALASEAFGAVEPSVSLHERLRPLVEAVHQALDAQGAALLLVDASGRHLVPTLATGCWSTSVDAAPLPLDSASFVAQVAASDEPVELADATSASLAVDEGVRRGGVRSLLGLRLWPHGKLLGVLYLGVAESRPFTPQARRYFETLVEYLSGIIDKALLLQSCRQTNERLRQSETRYRLATEAISDAIWDWNLLTDTLSWSPGVEKLFGHTHEELGEHISGWYGHIHPEERERVVQSVHGAIDVGAERWRGEYRFRHRDGHYVRVVDQGVIERDAGGKAVRMVGAMQDVTQQRAAAVALRQSEDRERLALNAAELGTWDYNPVTHELRWDARCKALFGLSARSEVSWDTFLAGLHPEDRERTNAVVQRALYPHGTGEYDIEYRTVGLEDGRERWVRATGRAFFEGGRAVRFIGTVQDVSALKAAQQALERNEQAFRTLAESMPAAVWTARPDGSFDYVNDTLLRYTGATRTALLGGEHPLILHPEDVGPSLERWARSVETGEPFEVEQRIRGRDGTYRWFLMRAHPLKDASGRVVKWFGTSMDIHDLREAQAELQRRSQFEQQLIGIVSHDLRNPLAAIALSATVLRRAALDERQMSAIARILASADRANRMIRDLLDFTQARLGGGIPITPKPVDFHELTQQVVDEVRLAHPGRRIGLAGSSTQGSWDPDRMAQVITNLLNNALAYSPPGTPVRVETWGEAGEVWLSVHNEGAAIPAELVPHLFEPMHRGEKQRDAASRSIGLGLFIVKQIVDAHGGSIAVHSTGSEGTTFTVRLPLRPPEKGS